jgi:hypothetical protein
VLALWHYQHWFHCMEAILVSSVHYIIGTAQISSNHCFIFIYITYQWSPLLRWNQTHKLFWGRKYTK